jgi:hypothetical protein
LFINNMMRRAACDADQQPNQRRLLIHRKNNRRHPRLDPGVHLFRKLLDCRIKSGNDEKSAVPPYASWPE